MRVGPYDIAINATCTVCGTALSFDQPDAEGESSVTYLASCQCVEGAGLNAIGKHLVAIFDTLGIRVEVRRPQVPKLTVLDGGLSQR